MKFILVAGVNDSGKSTLIKRIVNLASGLSVGDKSKTAVATCDVGGHNLIAIPSGTRKRELLQIELHLLPDTPWSALDQPQTDVLNRAFFNWMSASFGTYDVLLVETHLVYRHETGGFVSVVPGEWMREAMGIILMDVRPQLVFNRTVSIHKERCVITDVEEEMMMEKMTAEVANSVNKTPLLKILARDQHPAIIGPDCIPNVDQQAKLALQFISGIVGRCMPRKSIQEDQE